MACSPADSPANMPVPRPLAVLMKNLDPSSVVTVAADDHPELPLNDSLITLP